MTGKVEELNGYLRIKEAAEYLGVSPNTLRNWGRSEKIAQHRHPVNNYRLYKKTELDRLLRATEEPRAEFQRNTQTEIDGVNDGDGHNRPSTKSTCGHACHRSEAARRH